MASRMTIRIGTSGWHYNHWMGVFYGPSIRKTDWLAYYSERFRTVEINNSFYRMPAAGTLRAWRETAPEGFIFTLKASRFITHYMSCIKNRHEP